MATTIPVDQLDGVAGQVKAILTEYKTDMVAKGLDPTTIMTGGETKRVAMTAKNQEQEAARTAWKERTDELGVLKDEVYSFIASGCDLIITAFGRTSPRGQEATRIRKQLTTRSVGGAEPPAPQPPTP